MSRLFKGVRGLTQTQFEELVSAGKITVGGEEILYDKDFLYFTPEDVTEIVREHTALIAQNASDITTNKNNIVNNASEISSLKSASMTQATNIAAIENAISEIILRDTTQDNRLTNLEDDYASKDFVLENGGKIDRITVNGTEQTITNKTVNIVVPDISKIESDLLNVVNLDNAQTITGPKTFVEHIYLANADGTVDRISHLNNNFIIHSGATNSSVLNIDEGLEKIYAFNNELAFKSDIAEAAGTTVYVAGTAVADLSFSADPQTQINLIAEGLDDNKSELTTNINTKVSKSGDIMTGELTASAGIAFGNNKVRAENAGNTFEIIHIENNVDKNVFNYTHGAIFTLNNSETPVIIQGLDDRPSYVSGSGIMSDLALESDIPTKVSDLTNDNNYDTVADVNNKISSNLTTAKSYTDTKIADLIDSAPETLDTLAEVAQAIKDNETVVDALNDAIGTKADKTTVDALTTRVNTNETNIINLQNNKADKTEIPTTLSQLSSDSTHRLVTDAEKAGWNAKLSSYTETDPTVPDWAKQATKPEYDYSEIKNTPESVDINLDAINFAEEERQKSKNLFRPYEILDDGVLTDGVLDLVDTEYHPFMAENFYVSYPGYTNDYGAVWFRRAISDPDRWMLQCRGNVPYNIKITNLKPNTAYTISFTVKYCAEAMYFLNKYIAENTATHTNELSNTFTTDDKGEYVFTNGYRGTVAGASNGGLCHVVNIQLEEGAVKTEYVLPYGPVVHGWSLPAKAGETKSKQHDTVVEYYLSGNGKTWYRKWASGWKECGGVFSITSSGYQTYTLPIAFSNKNYIALKQIDVQNNSNTWGVNEIFMTQTGVQQVSSFLDANYTARFYCAGY